MAELAQRLQLSVGLNVAGEQRGAQVAGLANIALQKKGGFQLGFVNYAGELNGAQVGLINITEKSDERTCLSDVFGGVFPLVNTCWENR